MAIASSVTRGKRKQFVVDGTVVYEWMQTLDGVEMFMRPPEGVRAKDLDIAITSDHLRVGLKGNPPFIDEDLFGRVVVKDSMWTLDSGEICIDFKKATAAETWSSVLKGKGALNVAEVAAERQNLLLERFQAENPGFDFSNAEFTGQAPDARDFMGGLDYNRLNPR
ncbi:CS domain-containing protein [Plasmodiophora brassicae]